MFLSSNDKEHVWLLWFCCDVDDEAITGIRQVWHETRLSQISPGFLVHQSTRGVFVFVCYNSLTMYNVFMINTYYFSYSYILKMSELYPIWKFNRVSLTSKTNFPISGIIVIFAVTYRSTWPCTIHQYYYKIIRRRNRVVIGTRGKQTPSCQQKSYACWLCNVPKIEHWNHTLFQRPYNVHNVGTYS